MLVLLHTHILDVLECLPHPLPTILACLDRLREEHLNQVQVEFGDELFRSLPFLCKAPIKILGEGGIKKVGLPVQMPAA